MAETVEQRISRYLDEAHAAEHHLARTFGDFAEDASGPGLRFASLRQAAGAHESALREALAQRGHEPAAWRTHVAGALGALALHTRPGSTPDEKRVAHDVFAVAATAFQMGTYAALAASAAVVREGEVERLASTLRDEEKTTLASLEEARQSSAGMQERGASGGTHGEGAPPANTTAKSVVAALEDAIAAGHTFLSQSEQAARRAERQAEAQPEAKAAGDLFTEHATLTRQEVEQMTRRLQSLGAEPSVLKGFFAEVFSSAPKLARLGHDTHELLVQDMVMLFANLQAQRAICRALAQTAAAAGDATTETLALVAAKDKEEFVAKVWAEIAPAAEVSIGTMPYALG